MCSFEPNIQLIYSIIKGPSKQRLPSVFSHQESLYVAIDFYRPFII